ncbi:SpoIIE family protein phosphatase [Conexibacter sp. CPCC 206217]|uniref:SpoIIE family protein phosphatase n=1 Tax=Conexibacter sp. CPCC 206217 TaxID=3064574 RepID=UPI00272449A4|nr:SpoIIE family protein phosphatase [Conexibacter sp. CPCC 206217]MDO8210495.1 SpoIIE family protein phosphatase [Conexibacter sp. CPCC 206217]
MHPDVALGVANVAAGGEAVSGDACVAAVGRDGVLVAAIDGLGHGVAASAASQLAARVVQEHVDDPLPALVCACHEALADTRGAALTVARIDVRAHTLTWLGVGNVAGVLVPAVAGAPSPAALLLAGVVGDQLPQLVPVTLPLVPGDTVLLATDGVSGAVADDLRVRGALGPLADGLLRRHRRGPEDDALVLLARFAPGEGAG